MRTTVVTVLAGLGMAGSAAAGELTPEQARHFVAEKMFSYNCFDGTTGTGRIHSDGSVIGTMRPRGTGPLRYVSLPSGTVKVSSDSICASLNNSLFQPCFNVNQTSPVSFRGSLTLLSFAYCDFTRLNGRRMMTAGLPMPLAPRASKPRRAPVTPVTAEALPPPSESSSAVELRPSKD